MQADTLSVQTLFQDRRQYRVPFFQRSYVWNKEDQWEPLWADVADKADTRAEGESPVPHFLGAAVLEPLKRDSLIGVESANIIDGQQRLTTLQYLLTALAIVLRQAGDTTLLSIVEGCLQNSNPTTMQDPKVEIYKVWPTFRDRTLYQLAMTAHSLDDLRTRFPDNFTQNGSLKKIGIEHPPALGAIWFFAEHIFDWAGRDQSQLHARLSALGTAIFRDLQIVCISLGEKDDAQVIFETLNGRGAELHATDLIRNFIFMRADREDVPAGPLYENYWRPFEDSFWTESQRRGRLSKPRMEWFVQTSLQAITKDDVEIGRLYASYRRFALPASKPVPAADQLASLHCYGELYKQLVTGIGSSPIARYGKKVAAWDASTTHSLAVFVASSNLSEDDQNAIFGYLTSYLVRRAICGLTSKNYNKIFMQLLRRVAGGPFSVDKVTECLGSPLGEASRWPSDEEFRKAWVSNNSYPGNLDATRTKAVLSELESSLRSHQTEEPNPYGLDLLDIDHILPTNWYAHWKLADDTLGTEEEAKAASYAGLTGNPISLRQESMIKREEAKATIGNLTLLHYGLNRSVQHREFLKKQAELIKKSNLHLNRDLMLLSDWNEKEIEKRSTSLFDVALPIWPFAQRPTKEAMAAAD